MFQLVHLMLPIFLAAELRWVEVPRQLAPGEMFLDELRVAIAKMNGTIARHPTGFGSEHREWRVDLSQSAISSRELASIPSPIRPDNVIEGSFPMRYRERIVSLDLTKTTIDDDATRHLISLHTLKVIRLGYTRITGVGVKRIIASRLPLVSIDLSGLPVSSVSIERIEDQHSINSIDLSRTEVDDEAAKYLSKCKTLTELNLSSTSISNRALEWFASTAHDFWLLRLSDCRVTNEGVRSLSKLSRVNHLDLSHTDVTDECIANLINVKYLRILEIRNTALTEVGVQRIKKALPGTRIIY